MRLRMLAMCMLLVGLIGFVVACGAPKSGGFTEIDRSKIPAPLTATTTTTTTTSTTMPNTTTTVFEPVSTTTFVPVPTTIDSALTTLYFIAGKDQLFAIETPLARKPSASQVMAALEAGPTGTGAQGLHSAIPHGPVPVVTEDLGHGLVTIDLSPSFRADTGGDQRLAIGQIVLTMTQLSGISQVTFTENGAKVKVQLADGQLSDEGAILYAADYTQLMLSTAPTSTTTTSTTTSSTTTTSTASISTAPAPTTFDAGPTATSAAATQTADPSVSPSQTSLPRA